MGSNSRPVPVRRPIDQEDWVTAFFQTADQCNADLTAEWFVEDIDMRLANHPPVSSKAEAREGLRQFMSNISGMVHQRESRVMEDNAAVQMGTVRHTLPDGREVPLPVAATCVAMSVSASTGFGSISIWRRYLISEQSLPHRGAADRPPA